MRTLPFPLPAAEDTALRAGALTLDPRGYAVSVDGNDVFLTVSEFLLLEALIQHPYRVLDRAALWAAMQGSDSTGLPGDGALRAVDRHVARLRKKLAAVGYTRIQTMRQVGYRLVP